MERKSVAHHVNRLRELPLRDLLVSMRKLVEKTSRLLLAKGGGAAEMRMQKKLGMMRMALLDRMHRKLKESVDVDFFVEMIDFIGRAEELIEQYEHDTTEWQEFLDLLEKKLEAEGIIVETAELKDQNRRLKEAAEKLRAKLEGRPPFRPLS